MALPGRSRWTATTGRAGASARKLERSSASLRRPRATDDGDEELARSEADIESLEARLGIGRKGREAKTQPTASTQADPAQARQRQADAAKKVEWKEGSLTPEGWNAMNVTEKVVQGLWGEKGFLYWLNYLSYRLIFVMIGGWILFRFVGPAMGIYQLTNPFDLSTVPI